HLQGDGDLPFHFLGGSAGILGHHLDDGGCRVRIGLDIDEEESISAEDHQGHHQHRDDQGAVQGPLDQLVYHDAGSRRRRFRGRRGGTRRCSASAKPQARGKSPEDRCRLPLSPSGKSLACGFALTAARLFEPPSGTCCYFFLLFRSSRVAFSSTAPEVTTRSFARSGSICSPAAASERLLRT